MQAGRDIMAEREQAVVGWLHGSAEAGASRGSEAVACKRGGAADASDVRGARPRADRFLGGPTDGCASRESREHDVSDRSDGNECEGPRCQEHGDGGCGGAAAWDAEHASAAASCGTCSGGGMASQCFSAQRSDAVEHNGTGCGPCPHPCYRRASAAAVREDVRVAPPLTLSPTPGCRCHHHDHDRHHDSHSMKSDTEAVERSVCAPPGIFNSDIRQQLR